MEHGRFQVFNGVLFLLAHVVLLAFLPRGQRIAQGLHFEHRILAGRGRDAGRSRSRGAGRRRGGQHRGRAPQLAPQRGHAGRGGGGEGPQALEQVLVVEVAHLVEQHAHALGHAGLSQRGSGRSHFAQGGGLLAQGFPQRAQGAGERPGRGYYRLLGLAHRRYQSFGFGHAHVLPRELPRLAGVVAQAAGERVQVGGGRAQGRLQLRRPGLANLLLGHHQHPQGVGGAQLHALEGLGLPRRNAGLGLLAHAHLLHVLGGAARGQGGDLAVPVHALRHFRRGARALLGLQAGVGRLAVGGAGPGLGVALGQLGFGFQLGGGFLDFGRGLVGGGRYLVKPGRLLLLHLGGGAGRGRGGWLHAQGGGVLRVGAGIVLAALVRFLVALHQRRRLGSLVGIEDGNLLAVGRGHFQGRNRGFDGFGVVALQGRRERVHAKCAGLGLLHFGHLVGGQRRKAAAGHVLFVLHQLPAQVGRVEDAGGRIGGGGAQGGNGPLHGHDLAAGGFLVGLVSGPLERGLLQADGAFLHLIAGGGAVE